jgi:hypothetical protein
MSSPFKSGTRFAAGLAITAVAGLALAGSVAWFNPRLVDWLGTAATVFVGDWHALVSSERTSHPAALLGAGAVLIVIGEAGRRLLGSEPTR